MPWKAAVVSQLRSEFVHSVRSLRLPVAEACRRFDISRQTGYVWLRRFDQAPDARLVDRSRRPRRSPDRTIPEVEAAVLQTRERFRWGARKIHAVLRRQGVQVPSVRTVHAILGRHGCVRRDPVPDPAPLRFERSQPNELWQVDHVIDLEIARGRHDQFTVLDDHSRFLVAMPLVPDRTMLTAFNTLWILFGEFGLPDAVLCDNAFRSTHPVPRTLSWFDAHLIRLGIRPSHGRPFHPQTQGKVERLHRTIAEEFYPFARRDTTEHFEHDGRHWRDIYNALRPHEALGDQPPLARWRPSLRPRPASLPEVSYPKGSVLRRVSDRGLIGWRHSRILAGYGLASQLVRVEDQGHLINVYYANTLARSVPTELLRRDAIL